MLFSSIPFLYYFLPLVLIVYFAVPGKWKNGALLLSSLIFYGWGEPIRIVFLLLAAYVGYLACRIMDRYRGKAASKIALLFALTVDIGLLLLFKYAGFFVSNVNFLLGTSIDFAGFALPLGISFYTFQILSYVIDVYRGETAAQRSFPKLLLYVSLFPQLVAGPIERSANLLPQFHKTNKYWRYISTAKRFN